MSLLDQALAAHQAGKRGEAERLYRTLLSQEPEQADAMALLACLVSENGNGDDALRLIRRAISLDEKTGLFRFYLGVIAARAQDFKSAEAGFLEALARAPMAEAAYELGTLYRNADRWDDAAKAYEKAIELNPDFTDARNNLGLCYERGGDMAAAVAALRETTARNPHYVAGWLNLCRVAEKAGLYDAALAAAEAAEKRAPLDPSASFGAGVALNRLGRQQEAEGCYLRAINLRPDWVDAYDNLGQTYQFMNRIVDAEACYRRAIDLVGEGMPDEAVLSASESAIGGHHWHLALTELLKGDLSHGFARYRARFRELSVRRPVCAAPVWRGEDLRGKTILVYDEQGHGDALMLCRYLPLLKDRGARVLFWVQKPLVRFFENWDGLDSVISREAGAGTCDYCASIFDLPFAFETKLETIPNLCPYLPQHSGAEVVADTFKVGVVWAGAPLHKHDARRSVPLEIFQNLFDVTDVSFYSLNRDKRAGDEILLACRANAQDAAPRISDFADLAAWVGAMDLVITCDTATAHLAGGLGKPVWVLLPFAPDWRWFLGQSDSPWYPTARLFRQENPGDWAAVIGRVSAALKTTAQASAVRPSSSQTR